MCMFVCFSIIADNLLPGELDYSGWRTYCEQWHAATQFVILLFVSTILAFGKFLSFGFLQTSLLFIVGELAGEVPPRSHRNLLFYHVW